MAAPIRGKKTATILKGTPNEHTFYIEGTPGNLTPGDIAKIKKFYGIAEEASPQDMVNELNKLKEVTQANIISDIPYDPGSKEYYAEMSQKISDVNQRMKLIEDPANYYFKQAQEKLPFFLDKFVPDQLVSKPAFETAGALAAIGATGLAMTPTAGAAAKILGADALGATAGGQVYELTNQLLRYLNDLPTEDQATQQSKFLQDAYLNLAFSGGSMALGPLVKAFKPTIGKMLFGLKTGQPEFDKMLSVAETYGMPLGIIQATNNRFWKGYSEVLGIFPFVGTPFRRAAEGTSEATRQYFNNLTNGFAPLQTMSSLGGDVMKLARGQYDDSATISRILYEDFEEYAKRLEGKKVIKLDTVRDLSQKFVKSLEEAQPRAGYEPFKFPGASSEKAFKEFYQTMSRLDSDGVTIQQAKTLKELFSNFAANYKTETKGGFVPPKEGSRITQLALALERDMNTLVAIDDDIDKVVFDTAMKKLTTANGYLSDIMPKYEGPVPNLYKQVNANIFGPGPQSDTAGSMYAKEALDIVLGKAQTDPQVMEIVMRLAETPKPNVDAWVKAGKKEGGFQQVAVKILDDNPDSSTFGKTITKVESVEAIAPDAGKKKIIRKLFDNALEGSFSNLPVASTIGDYKNLKGLPPSEIAKYGFKEGVDKTSQDLFKFRTVEFDPSVFAEKIGLTNIDKRAALAQALKPVGTKIEDLQRFLEVAERAGSFTVKDPSKFVARRVTLGGFRSLLLFGAGTAGASALSGGIVPLMIPIMLRYGSSILSDPKVLKAFTQKLADTGLDVGKRTAVMGEVGKMTDVDKVLLDWANKTLPTQDELDQQDFVNQVEQSILSLMKEPQKKVEMGPARDQQLDMMGRMFGPRGITQEEAQIGGQLEERLAPTFPVDYEQLDYEQTMPAGASQNLSPDVRSNLAFGTLDDALETQMFKRGIGGL